MHAILGPLVYILIRPIGRRAIKKIESVKSVMSFFCIFLIITYFSIPFHLGDHFVRIVDVAVEFLYHKC